MNNRVIPVTLALNDTEQRKRIEQMIADNYMVRLMDEGADEMGVLIYEPGDTVDEDLPHIIQALESGQAEDVYLAGSHADSEILIRAMRSGIREFLRYPVEEKDFRAAIMRTAMRSSLDVDESGKGKIFTLLGSKSGLGASTLAVSLACTLNSFEPGKTLLLDLRRPAGEVSYFLDLKYDYTWGNLTEDISRLDSTYLRSVVAEHESGLHVLPGPSGSERPEDHTLFMILEQLRYNYDYVVVDTSYPHDETLPKEIEQADSILVAMQLTLPCLARTSRLMESIRSQDPNGERRIKLIANRVTKNSTIGIAEASAVLDRDITWIIPEDSDSSLSSINQGTPLVIAYPKSLASKAIVRMARDMGAEKKKVRKGFSLPFASLFRKKTAKNDDGLAGATT